MCRRKLRTFMKWMESSGIELSDGLQIVEGEGKGIASGEVGIRAAYDLQEGDAIALIPKKACLTLRTTGAAQLLDDARLSGGLGLVVALMYERSLGEASPWFPYLTLLPPRHDILPIVWDLEEIHSLLLGTELHMVVVEDRKLIEEDWRECIWPLTQLHPNEFPKEHFTLEHYFSAKTLVASRSFEVDNFHGYGMVPFADLFNHKTNGEDVHIMGDGDSSSFKSGRASAAQGQIDCSRLDMLEEQGSSEVGCDSPSRIVEGPSGNDILEMVLVRAVSQGSEKVVQEQLVELIHDSIEALMMDFDFGMGRLMVDSLSSWLLLIIFVVDKELPCTTLYSMPPRVVALFLGMESSALLEWMIDMIQGAICPGYTLAWITSD